MATRKLPTIRHASQLVPYLKRWQKIIDPSLARPVKLKSPWRFRATRKRGGNLLQWATVTGADGYEILRSDTPDFSSPLVIPIRSGVQNAYFDPVGGSPETKSYKIRATSGTLSVPHTVKGILSGIVTSTSIDSTDTVTAESTTLDTTTDDEIQAIASRLDGRFL